jgi:protein TonB
VDDFPDISFDDNAFDDWEPISSPPEVLPDDTPVRFSSDKAEFPGGLTALYKFLSDRIVYPPVARELGIQGKVYIDFVIEKDGTVSNVIVLKGIGYGCDEEAIRVIQSMPAWEAARQNGHRVRMAMTIPVKFTLRE